MILKLNFQIPLFLFVCIVLFCGCEKEFDYGKNKNAVKTLEISEVLQTTTKVAGAIETDNGAILSARGICYATTQNPTIAGAKKADPSPSLGNFTCLLENLSPGTTYYARAYATNSFGTAYGNSVSFTTQAATIPILTSTTTATLITPTSARSGGIITNTGASSVTSRGVCYSSTVTIPTITDLKTNDGTGIGTYISNLTGLSFNTTYYIRAYATNASGTAYGDVKSFSTAPATIPTSITTSTLTTITQTTATGGGNILGDGGASIVSRGVCWSSSTTTPTTATLPFSSSTKP